LAYQYSTKYFEPISKSTVNRWLNNIEEIVNKENKEDE
jgi:DNA-binding transcriptional regulator WhiA